MASTGTKLNLNMEIANFIKRDFSPHYGELKNSFQTNPAWQRLRELGTELWLDSGSIDEIEKIWTQEFSALTVNNTLLNNEVQSGRYDSLILEANQLLSEFPNLSLREKILETAFILNAWHGLRLVEKFDAYVSVEEHTEMANNVEQSVDYARRFYAICPERFIIKVPFTPAGLLATRKLSRQKIPINHTLGFSARQNYVIARIGKPAFVNVFLGRLNTFIADNKLGDGSYAGEKATLASQIAIRHLREEKKSLSRQIGASFRDGRQVLDLAGIDVMTIPPKVATQFLGLEIPPIKIADKTGVNYTSQLLEGIDYEGLRLNTLWEIDKKLIECVDALEKERLDSFTPDDLIAFFKKHDCADLMIRWTDSEIAMIIKDGKIPHYANWKDTLESKSTGLDSLMNFAGLHTFTADQNLMDKYIEKIWVKASGKRK